MNLGLRSCEEELLVKESVLPAGRVQITRDSKYKKTFICPLTAHRSLDRDSILRQTILPNGQMGENVWESMYGVFENNIFYCVVWNKIISLFIQSYNLFM